MTKFADQLYEDLIRAHGPVLVRTRPPAAPPRHIASRRTLLAAGAGCLAVAATAGTLVADGGTPAYALTTHPDGTATLAVYTESGIGKVNAQLRHLGDRVVVVPVHPWCRPITSMRAPAVIPKGSISLMGTGSRDGSITVHARGVPAGDIIVVGAEITPHGSEVASMLTSPPAPGCVSLPAPPSHYSVPGTSVGSAGGRSGSGPSLSRNG